MKYQELLILLPCHSLEDFPTYHEGDEADNLLASWSALWHPALLASAGAKPGWCRVDSPPSVLGQRLLIVPNVAKQQLPTGFAQRARDEGACLVRGQATRADIVSAALAQLDGGPPAVDPDLAADFMALGWCYLQVQILTRQMRYASNLDEVHFQNQIVAGAVAALAGDASLAREKLTACFDMLSEERNHYYPVEAYLLDLTLVAPTTLGPSLQQELNRELPINLLLSAECVRRLSTHAPDSLAALHAALAADRATVIGGESAEGRPSLVGLETLLAELQRGLATYDSTLGRRPTVFGRRRFGLTPAYPSLLPKLGFVGALHSTLDDGRFPQGSQLKIRWENESGAAIDAIARVPLDAAKPQTFLNLAIKLGESMDSDHVATLILAHWPGQASSWYEDLRRVTRYTSALGKFLTIDEYFRTTDAPGQIDRFDAGQYRSPYLKQAIIRKQTDPLSSVMRYWKRSARLSALAALDLMAAVASGGKSPSGAGGTSANSRADWAAQVDRLVEEPAADLAEEERLDQQLDQAVEDAARHFVRSLPRTADPAEPGLLVVNPHNVVRRMQTSAEQLASLPAVEKPVYAADDADGQRRVVVDVPALGYVWMNAGRPAPRGRRPVPPMAETGLLRNEFFEVLFNPVTGALQSIHEYSSRGNRISQQLALRTPSSTRQTAELDEADESECYSVMASDSVEVTAASTALGEITSRGRLLDRHGNVQARFVQVFQVVRGSRVLGIDITLEPLVEPQADPWNAYYCARFAWNDEGAELMRTLHQTAHPVTSRQFESPHFVDIVGEPKRTTILTGGLPFHRRVGLRMLDTLLIVRGERARKFRLGIGIDLTHPQHEAQAILTPSLAVAEKAPRPSTTSSWLFHVDARNVLVTNWSPLWDGGRLAGFQARLLETAGRTSRVKLSACRSISSAQSVDFRGQTLADLALDKGAAVVELGAKDWVEVAARW